jgi:hypothetical protein
MKNTHPFLHFRELAAMEVPFCPSEAGYYVMPDFDKCRAGLEKVGKANGDDLSNIFVGDYGLGVCNQFSFTTRHFA